MAKFKNFRYSAHARRKLPVQKQKAQKEDRKPSAKEKFHKLMADIPAVIAGKKTRNTIAKRRIYNAFWSSVILSLFTDIHDAYEVKSFGLPDELGNQWPDILPQTKAYKRPKRGLLDANQRRKYRQNTPGLLSPSQYKRWKKKFAQVAQAEERRLRRLGKTGDKTDIRAKAGKAAWTAAKNEGAETLIGTLGEADLLIMRVTDTLYDSLKPGKIVDLKYRKGDNNQVVRLSPGKLTIGTKVPYARMASSRSKTEMIDGIAVQFKSNKKREFLPDNLGIWYDRALVKGRNAIAYEIKKLADERKLV